MKYQIRILAAAAFLALVTTSPAQTTNIFTGASGGYWSTATNWSLGTVPASTNDVLINSNTTVNIISNSSAGTVTLSGANARFNILADVPLNATGIEMTGTSGNSLIFMDTGTMTLNGGTGSINTSGGVTSFLNINGNCTVNLATANLTYLWMKSGGSASVAAQLTITNGQTYNTAVTFLGSAAGQSTLNLSGGTLNAGTMIVTGSAVNITNIFNLNSGTLTASTIRRDYDGLVMNFNFNNGTIANAAGADLNISRNINATQNMVISLAGTGTHTFQADSGRTITVSSTAALADKAGEAGTLVKAGAGNLIFAGSNTYTGLTTVNAGTLSLTNGAAIADTGAVTLSNASGATMAVNSSETIGSLRGGGTTGGNVSLASGQTLTVAETGSQTFAGAITNTGSLTKSGAGTVILSGANTYSGATTIAAGTLQVGGGGTTGAIGSTSGIAISNGATLAFNRTDNYGGNFTRTLSGGGGVTVSGGTLTLQNTGNTFTGGVAVNGGTFMTLGNSAGSNIVVNSGGTLAMAGTDTWGGATVSSTPLVTINSGGQMTSDGYFNSLRDLTLNGGSVSLNGGLASTASAFVLGGTVTAGGALTSSITATTGSNNAIRLGRQGATEQTTFNVTNAAGQLTVDVTLRDNFGVTAGVNKTGAGKLVLSGSNDYTGATTVGGGTLQIGNGGTTGAISVNSALSVSNGATLAFNRTDNYGGAFNSAIAGAGTVAVNAGNLTLNAPGSSGYSTNLGIVVNNGGTVTLGHSDMFGGTGWDATTSPGFTVNAGGTLASSNNFNTLWNLNLNGGTLLANGGANSPAQAFALAGTVTVGGSSASLIQAGTNGNGLNMVNISGNGNSTLTFNVADVTSSSAADLTVTAGLQNNRGVLSSLNKTGAGLLVLAASNSYTGSTTVSGGTLQIGNGGTTGNLGAATDAIAISNGATLAFNRTDNYGGNFTRTLSGGGGVAVLGGTLTLQNTSNSFTGGVTVNGGTFKTLGNSAGSNIVVNNGGIFAMAGTDTWGNAAITNSPAVTINSGGTMTSDNQFNSLRNLTLNGGAVNLNGGLNSATGAFVLGGTVTVGGALTSSITATTGSNNFIRLGRETVVGGVTEFNVTNAAGLLTVAVELANNFNTSTAGLTKSGSGALTLSTSNTYTGLTTINAGTLSLTNGAAIADTGAVTLSNASGATLAVNSSETIGSLRGGGTTGGNVSLASGQTLTVAETGSQTFAGAITNTGSLTKSGAGTVILSGANTYSGATTIVAGTLQVGGGGTTGAIGSTSGIVISNGATLAFNRTDDYGGNFTRTLSGAGGLTVLGSGTVTLQNTGNSFTGGVAVNGGTFRTSGNSAGSNIVVNSGGIFAMAGTDTWGAATTTNTPSVTINSGGTMTSDGQFNSLRDLTLNGGSVNLNGGLNGNTGAFVLGGTVTVGGVLTSSITATAGSNNFIRLGRQGATEQTTFNVTNAAGLLTVGVQLDNNFGATAGLTKSGNGTVVLAAANSYSAGTTLNAGTLRLDHASAAGTGTITQSSGASTLQINTSGTVANAMNFYNVQTMQTVTLSGNKTLNNATYTVDSGTTTTESGVLSGSGGITKQGTGTLIVTASNSFTGNTLVSAGVLNLNSATGSALGASTNVTVSATLLISQSSQVSDSAAVTLSGGTITRGSGVSEVFGNLNVTAPSFLDFGTGATGNLSFGTYTSSALLTVQNFLPGNKLQFASGFNAALLPTGGNLSNANFSFSNGFTTGTEGGYFTITAIPEPSTVLAACGLLALFLPGFCGRRSRAKMTAREDIARP